MSDSRIYRTIWRWHFYAGLIVAPFLLILSVTGAIYLFNDELNDLTMPALHRVEAAAKPLPPSRLIRSALAAHPGSATRIDLPGEPTRPAKVYVQPADGPPLHVMVDPGSGRVLGDFVYTRTLVGFAEVMHGSLTLGPWGDALVELAACWALVLIATGLFLWWPRGRRSMAGVLWPRLAARGRAFWRDLHAVTGVWTVALTAFLILTGLPWAVVQGPLVRGAVAAMGIGNREDAWGRVQPASRPLREALGGIPWSQEALPMPASEAAHEGHGARNDGGPDPAAIAGADAIAARALSYGLRGYRLYLPSGPTGVYTALASPDQPEGQRTLVFDRWSGALIGDNGWRDYGAGAKAIELGVQIHMGRYFGRANQLLMLIPCVGIIVLVATGITMWWRRRPSGALGAPPPVSGARLRGAVAFLAVAGLALPLFGGSLLLLALADRLVRRRPEPVGGQPV
jgi:uncharacterized iron-regulated membrane protein